MMAYRKERIENAILYFAKEHYNKTHIYVSQTVLFKYLAFFEFRHLSKYGEMPLGLEYKAMDHGPVPVAIYSRLDNPQAFPMVRIEKTATGKIIKPAEGSRFNADYFSQDELTEMKNLIEIFAQRWVGASVMSDASHREILAWRKTYKRQPNAVIDPIDNFQRDVLTIPFDDLEQAEERYLRQRKIQELINC